MKRLIVLLLVLVCLFPAAALGDGKLSITDKNLIVYEGDDSGYLFAKVQNTGDADVGVGYGSLAAFSENDEIIFTDGYISSTQGRINLKPGEYTYVSEYIWETALETTAVADYKFSMKPDGNADKMERVVSKAIIDLGDANSYNHYIYVTFTNTTDVVWDRFNVTVALIGNDGRLLFADGDTTDDISLHPGGTITKKIYIRHDLVEYYERNDLKPDSVDSIVSYTVD